MAAFKRMKTLNLISNLRYNLIWQHFELRYGMNMAYLQTHKKSSYKTIQYMFKRIAYFHGHKTITDSLIKNYQKKRLADGVLGSTINRELELAKAAFNRALRGNQVVANPFVRFDKFTEVERTRYLTQEELKALLGVLKKVSSYKVSPLI